MLIEKQIGALTFTPEVKRVTFNGSQVREFRDTMEKMLAVAEAAQAWLDSEDDDEEYFAVRKLTSALSALVLDRQTRNSRKA